MGTITLTGFSFFQGFDGEDDTPFDFDFSTELTLAFADPSTATFRYVYEPFEGDDGDRTFFIDAESDRPLLADIAGAAVLQYDIEALRLTVPEGFLDLLFFRTELCPGGFDGEYEFVEYEAVFLLDGTPDLFPTNEATLFALFALFETGGANISEIPDISPVGPGVDFSLSGLPDATVNTGPQTIISGNVALSGFGGVSEIGVGASGPGGDICLPDGSVAVLGGDTLTLDAALLRVGATGGLGTLAVANSGSVIELRSDSAADADLIAAFGGPFGAAGVNVEDGGTLRLVSGYPEGSPAADNDQLGLVIVGSAGFAELIVDDGTLAVEGFGAAALSVGFGGGEGLVEIRNGGVLLLQPTNVGLVGIGISEGGGGTDGRLHIHDGGRVEADRLLSLDIGRGDQDEGLLVIDGPGSEFVATAPEEDDMIVRIGSAGGAGQIVILDGGVMDLGGAGLVSLAAEPNTPVAGSAEIFITGAGSTLTGIDTLWAGVDPELEFTPPAQALILVDGASTGGPGTAVLGNAGAEINLGLGSEVLLGDGAVLRGAVNLYGTDIAMLEGAARAAAIDGDLNVMAGASILDMRAYGEGDGDTLDITGSFSLAGDPGASLLLVFDGANGHEFAQGETHRLLTFGQLIDGDAVFDVFVPGSGAGTSRAWKIEVDDVTDGALTFTALTDWDDGATGDAIVATLDFSGGSSTVELFYDPPEDGFVGRIGWQGGGIFGGFASDNIDMIIGTDEGDSFNLEGLATDIRIFGGAGADLIVGGEGNDIIAGGAGNDTIDGGGGTNTAVFSGNKDDYTIFYNTALQQVTVTDSRDDGDDANLLTNIQSLQFADQTVTVEFPDDIFILSGTVTLRGIDLNPEGTQVVFTPDQGEVLQTAADAAGFFAFDLAPGTTGTLSLARAHDPAPGPDKTLTALDALEVLKMVVGLAPGNAREVDALAADYNGDGMVNALDALDILKQVVALPDAIAPEWVFAPTADLPGDPLDWPDGLSGLPTGTDLGGIEIGAMTENVALDMTGILRGDMGYYELT